MQRTPPNRGSKEDGNGGDVGATMRNTSEVVVLLQGNLFGSGKHTQMLAAKKTYSAYLVKMPI